MSHTNNLWVSQSNNTYGASKERTGRKVGKSNGGKSSMKKKITRIDYLTKKFKNKYQWGMLSKWEQKLFKDSPQEFARLYFKTWGDEIKKDFEKYLEEKRKEQQ